jgi:hypothetical protein
MHNPMKRILIICGTIWVAMVNITVAQSPFLTFRFANAFIKPGTPDTLIFDIQAKCDVTGTYHTDIMIYMNYNSAAFGANIVNSGNFGLVRADLTDEEVFPGFLYKYEFYPFVDHTSNRVIFGSYPNYTNNMSRLTQVPSTFTPYVKIKLPIADANQTAGISFEPTLMNGNQFYQTVPDSPQAYGDCVFENDLSLLPLNPNTSLLISEVADPSNSTANFVEIYNSGTSAVDFDASYPWYLNYNGSSSVQLTGSLVAGGRYVIAENAASFTAASPGKSYNLVSSGIGTAGNTTYLLTTYGDYASGTNIDVYDGAASGFDFTGKHAVRKYPVVTPNPTLTASEWVITPGTNMDMTPGSHRRIIYWDGSTGFNWSDTANWTPSFVPDAGHNAQVPVAIQPPPTIGTGNNANCHDLQNGSN